MRPNKFLLVLTVIVLLIGVARLVLVYSNTRSGDQKILINKSKQ